MKRIFLILLTMMASTGMLVNSTEAPKKKKISKKEATAKRSHKANLAPAVLIPVNNTAFVDPVNGKDHGPSAGRVGQLTLPFKTIAAAVKAVKKLKPSKNNTFTIQLTAGEFIINNPKNYITLPGWVDLIGSGTNATVIKQTFFNPATVTINPTPFITFNCPGRSAVRNLTIESRGNPFFTNGPLVDDQVHEIGQCNLIMIGPDVPNTLLLSKETFGMNFGAYFHLGYYRFVDNVITMDFQAGPDVTWEGFAQANISAQLELDTNKIFIRSIPIVPNPDKGLQTQVTAIGSHPANGCKIIKNGNTIKIQRLTGAVPTSMFRTPLRPEILHAAALKHLQQKADRAAAIKSGALPQQSPCSACDLTLATDGCTGCDNVMNSGAYID